MNWESSPDGSGRSAGSGALASAIARYVALMCSSSEARLSVKAIWVTFDVLFVNVIVRSGVSHNACRFAAGSFVNFREDKPQALHVKCIVRSVWSFLAR